MQGGARAGTGGSGRGTGPNAWVSGWVRGPSLMTSYCLSSGHKVKIPLLNKNQCCGARAGTCCPEPVLVVRSRYLFSRAGTCCPEPVLVVRSRYLLSGAGTCCLEPVLVVRNRLTGTDSDPSTTLRLIIFSSSSFRQKFKVAKQIQIAFNYIP